MEKQKKQLIILSGMIVVLIILSVRAFVIVKKSRDKVKRAEAVQEMVKTRAATMPSKGDVIPSKAQEESMAQQLSWEVDPFTGSEIYTSSARYPALRLVGIVYSKEKPQDSYAIIDNFIVKKGDKIGSSDFQLIEISEHDVTVTDGTKELKLKVW
jgi:hypothetical protein